jgi:uncharacterized protein (DUF1501 family)
VATWLDNGRYGISTKCPGLQGFSLRLAWGGNDGFNTVIPFDTAQHAAYMAARGPIAIGRHKLAETALLETVNSAGGARFALHPALSPLVPLFQKKALAVVLNVGPLITPITKAEYLTRTAPIPRSLFSHNDQASMWQSLATEGAPSGWGGKIGDLFESSNARSTFTCISVNGNSTFLVGRDSTQYRTSIRGPMRLTAAQSLYGSSAAADALRQMMTLSSPNLMEREIAAIARRSLDAADIFSLALGAQNDAKINIPDTFIGNQLAMVAKTIAARKVTGAKRQVFFVSVGSFDTHSDQLIKQGKLLSEVGEALAAFHQAMIELGVAEGVTVFTASDFGRTLNSNGDGTDHGWGSHHFVLGGAVRGGKIYGTEPELIIDGPSYVHQTRLIPTLSVTEFGATMASWFGVSPSDLPFVMQNIQNFPRHSLEFL